jgi:hypothetical protein
MIHSDAFASVVPPVTAGLEDVEVAVRVPALSIADDVLRIPEHPRAIIISSVAVDPVVPKVAFIQSVPDTSWAVGVPLPPDPYTAT